MGAVRDWEELSGEELDVLEIIFASSCQIILQHVEESVNTRCCTK